MAASQSRFRVKYLPDGRALVNLGSSSRVAPGWTNVDFSWIMRLGRHRRLCAWLFKLGLIHPSRYARIQQIDPDTVVWDLAKGIPFPDQTFEGVYHCHVLEHIDRDAAPKFLLECRRVLKRNGVVRVVVPDLEFMARRYVDIVARLPERANLEEHAQAVEALFDQMIIRTPRFRKEQKPIVRLLEHLVVGDTAKAGILHRWAYDRFSLAQLLTETGFNDIQFQTATSSQIAGWTGFNLDTEPDGSIYKPGSLYLEGRAR
jgi:SAM-dependent methyltransferase